MTIAMIINDSGNDDKDDNNQNSDMDESDNLNALI